MTYSSNWFLHIALLILIKSRGKFCLGKVDCVCIFNFRLFHFCFDIAREKFQVFYVKLAKTSRVVNHFWFIRHLLVRLIINRHGFLIRNCSIVKKTFLFPKLMFRPCAKWMRSRIIWKNTLILSLTRRAFQSFLNLKALTLNFCKIFLIKFFALRKLC